MDPKPKGSFCRAHSLSVSPSVSPVLESREEVFCKSLELRASPLVELVPKLIKFSRMLQKERARMFSYGCAVLTLVKKYGLHCGMWTKESKLFSYW